MAIIPPKMILQAVVLPLSHCIRDSTAPEFVWLILFEQYRCTRIFALYVMYELNAQNWRIYFQNKKLPIWAAESCRALSQSISLHSALSAAHPTRNVSIQLLGKRSLSATASFESIKMQQQLNQ